MSTWLKDAVFYEIYPQSFYDTNGDGIGDLQGIIEKLDYVSFLGANALWLNPIYDSPFMDAGYDVRDYFSVAPRYGTNADAKRLFEEAHKRGIKVVLDLVPGHTSDQCEMFLKSALPTKNEFTDRFIWTDSAWQTPKEFKCLSGKSDRDGAYIVNFFATQPALNYGFNKITENWQQPAGGEAANATRDWLISVMRFWLNMGADGFRVDMADSLVKNDDEDKTETCKIYNKIREVLNRDYPEAVLIAEWSNPRLSLRAGFDADFYLDNKGNGYNKLTRFGELDGRNVRQDGLNVSFFAPNGTEDITGFLDDYYARYNASKDYGYISFITCNHDIYRMTKWFDERTHKIAVAFILLQAGVPFLYYGDEIGMKYIEGLTSKEGGYHRTGSRTPMQWNAGKNLGFSESDSPYLPTDGEKDAPTVQNQLADPNSILSIVRDIIKLRRSTPDLNADAPLEVVYAEKGVRAFIGKRGGYYIAVNPNDGEMVLPFESGVEAVYEINDKAKLADGKIVLPPRYLGVFKA